MATQTIRGLPATGTLTSSMVIPTAPTSGADTKTSVQQLSEFVAGNYFVPEAYCVFVDLNGNDANPGTQYLPFQTITAADAAAGNSQIVKIGQYAFNETAIVKKSGVGWIGNGNNETFLSFSDSVTIVPNWTAFSSPYIDWAEFYISAVNGVNLIPPGYAADSEISLSGIKVEAGTALSIGYVDRLYVKNFFEIDNPYIADVVSGVLSDGIITGDITIESLDSASVPTINVILRDLNMNGGSITLKTGYTGTGNFNVTIEDCRNIGQIFYDDGGNTPSNLYIDADSWPAGGVNDGSGQLTIVKTTNVVDGISLVNGLGPRNGNFYWTGENNPDAFSFMCGEGNHGVNVGERNILLGNWSASSKTGCFVWSDSTAISTANHYPSADNQALFFAAGGLGIGTNNDNGGVFEGPQAGFHYAHNYGNDGNFLASMVAEVPDAKMWQNETVNPYLSADNLILKRRTNAGGIVKSTVRPDLTETIVMGVGAAPNINASTTQNVIAIGPLAGASLPNNPSNQSRSTFIGYNCAASYTTSGSPNDQHTGVGYFALRNMTTAQFNTAVGSTALLNLTTSSFNTAIGNGAAENLKTGTGQNTVLGTFAARGATNASFSNMTIIGYDAGSALNTATDSVIVGANAGDTLASGSNNVLIGASSDISSGAATNRIGIGQGVTVSNDNQAVIGNSSLSSIISNSTTAALGTSSNPWAGLWSSGVVNTDRIAGRTTDLRINPSASGEAVYIGHDHASSRVLIGVGSTASMFAVVNTVDTNFNVASTGVVSTKQNVLDDTLSNNSLYSFNSAATLGTPAHPWAAIYASSISTPPVFVTGTSQTIAAGVTYIANSSSLITFTLPNSMVVGSSFKIKGYGSGLFKIAQTSSDQIFFLSQSTTAGTGGSITATQRYQEIEVTCIGIGIYVVGTGTGATWTVV